jgi:3-oxoacyl-(acyl-carrier-protein) synthase
LKQRVYIGGLGVISAIGQSVIETRKSFKLHQSGIGDLTLFKSVHALPVGEVKLTNQELASTLHVPATLSRTALLGIHAARQAVESSGIDLKQWRTGCISATTVGGMDKTENFIPSFLANKTTGNLEDVMHHECGSITEIIANDLGIKDFVSTVNTACSSSVNSIILGARLIALGQLDVVIAGGTDALSKFTLNGFNSLMILDTNPCKPFDANRKGLNLGEGAGFVVLVSERVLKEEKINAICFVAGYGNTNDAFHQTASSPEGRGSYAAMKQALSMAGLLPQEIHYINLHGTGTQNNDSSEGNAVQNVFGSKVPFVSSTKAFTGHTLGASGGVEAVFSVLSIKYGMIFPNLRFEMPMPGLSYTPVINYDEGLLIEHVMSNSFGFGGNCSSIIFSRVV